MRSLPNTLLKCRSTVRGLINSWTPISWSERPRRASRATWRSCAVSSSSVSTEQRAGDPHARSAGGGTHGPLTAPPAPEPGATITAAHYAHEAAPEVVSCGAVGKPAPRTTPERHTARQRHISAQSRHRRASGPTLLPPSGWPGRPSPNGRPAGPSAQRLPKPQPATTTDVDTGRLSRLGGTSAIADGRSGRRRGADLCRSRNETRSTPTSSGPAMLCKPATQARRPLVFTRQWSPRPGEADARSEPIRGSASGLRTVRTVGLPEGAVVSAHADS